MAHQYPPLPPRKKNTARNVLLACVGVFMVSLVGCVAVVATSAHQVAKNPEINAPKKVHAFNTPAEDGAFTFRVTRVERTDHVGDSLTGQDAQGEFLVVTVTVFNHSRTAKMLDASSQKLIAGKATYDATEDLTSDAFLKNINPGNSVSANLAFDVPKGTKGDQVVLHDSPFSNGVRVSLSH